MNTIIHIPRTKKRAYDLQFSNSSNDLKITPFYAAQYSLGINCYADYKHNTED